MSWISINGKNGSLFFIDRMTAQQKDALEKATNPFSSKPEQEKK